VRDRPSAATQVTVELRADQITFTAADRVLRAAAVEHDFPDWQRLQHLSTTHRGHIDVAALRRQLTSTPTLPMRRDNDGVTYEVAVLSIDPNGEVRVAGDSTTAARIGVNQEFLLQALDAGNAAELLLDLDGPITPLAIRNPDQADTFSILMPVRLP